MSDKLTLLQAEKRELSGLMGVVDTYCEHWDCHLREGDTGKAVNKVAGILRDRLQDVTSEIEEIEDDKEPPSNVYNVELNDDGLLEIAAGESATVACKSYINARLASLFESRAVAVTLTNQKDESDAVTALYDPRYNKWNIGSKI